MDMGRAFLHAQLKQDLRKLNRLSMHEIVIEIKPRGCWCPTIPNRCVMISV